MDRCILHPGLPVRTPCYNFTEQLRSTAWWAVCTHLRDAFRRLHKHPRTSDSRFKVREFQVPIPPARQARVEREQPITLGMRTYFHPGFLEDSCGFRRQRWTEDWMQPCTTTCLSTPNIVRLEGLHPIKPHAPPLKTDPVKHLGFDHRWSLTRPVSHWSTQRIGPHKLSQPRLTGSQIQVAPTSYRPERLYSCIATTWRGQRASKMSAIGIQPLAKLSRFMADSEYQSKVKNTPKPPESPQFRPFAGLLHILLHQLSLSFTKFHFGEFGWCGEFFQNESKKWHYII